MKRTIIKLPEGWDDPELNRKDFEFVRDVLTDLLHFTDELPDDIVTLKQIGDVYYILNTLCGAEYSTIEEPAPK